MGRLLLAAVGAGLVVAAYVALLYGFFIWIWPVLPDWAMLIAFLLIAAAVIGSPIMALKYYGTVRSAARRARGDHTEDDRQ
ncbi:hypothetical protein [Aquisalimonas sp.]|uniref:hypothetical protein n=1 Tax=Aquisalimonas sp. TaxID=1872621 RepID=UPI0025C3887E|nr:hypothetical protein [Aquisalimonas sp.]